ncbi:hypothetical protein CRG98_041089 [Punica granatum]|uniref:Uncharacterized protein n=1 Tax=Punica granatum TaxID=22663 RepID=A0A2I0I3G3_PUNGR|nr:hypothetical protein CRG98_041089 [Punica granatum]
MMMIFDETKEVQPNRACPPRPESEQQSYDFGMTRRRKGEKKKRGSIPNENGRNRAPGNRGGEVGDLPIVPIVDRRG